MWCPSVETILSAKWGMKWSLTVVWVGLAQKLASSKACSADVVNLRSETKSMKLEISSPKSPKRKVKIRGTCGQTRMTRRTPIGLWTRLSLMVWMSTIITSNPCWCRNAVNEEIIWLRIEPKPPSDHLKRKRNLQDFWKQRPDLWRRRVQRKAIPEVQLAWV